MQFIKSTLVDNPMDKRILEELEDYCRFCQKYTSKYYNEPYRGGELEVFTIDQYIKIKYTIIE